MQMIWFFQFYWGLIGKKIFKCTTWWFEIHIRHERIPSPYIKLIKISVTSYISLFFFWWEHVTITLSKFQLYNIVLSATVTMLYTRCLDLIHFTAEILCPFISFSLFLFLPCHPHAAICLLYFYKFIFKKFHI